MAAQKRSNNLIIVLGLLTAVVGAGLVLLLINRGGDSESSSSGNGETVPVLVAKKAISVGTAGADLGDSVEVRQVPSVTRASDALVSLGELADRTTAVAIGPDQQLRSAFFRQRTVRGDAIKVPDGKQAVPLTIPFSQAGGGYIGPGDMVNVYAILAKQNGVVVPQCEDDKACPGIDPRNPGASQQAATQLVLSNVQVLDISREVAPRTVTSVQPTAGNVARAGGDQTEEEVMTLVALDAVQAERAIFFQAYTDIFLTLVPKDQPPQTTPGRDQTTALKP